MQAIVLAASGGHEFGPLCEEAPKASLPFLGKPLLAHTIQYLEAQGMSEIVVSVYRQPYALERHFSAFPPKKTPLRFQLEGADGGRADAIKRAFPRAQETLVVCQGHLITTIDLSKALAEHKAKQALVTVVLVPGALQGLGDRLVVDASGRVKAIIPNAQEQSQPLSTGIYLVEPEALGFIPSGACEMDRHFLPLLLEKNLPLYGYISDGYWMDVGSPQGYMRALSDALHARIDGVVPVGEQVTPGVWVAPGALIHPKAKLVAPVYVGARARVRQEATLGPVVSVEGACELARGAKVIASAVFPHTKVGKATRFESALLFPHGQIELVSSPPRVLACDDAAILGTTYHTPRLEVLHTTFDQLLAALGLLAIAPLLLMLIIAIKLDSRGPAFYTQLRVGQERRPYRQSVPQGAVFEVYKFRTMYQDADRRVEELIEGNQYGNSAFFKLENDPRITRVGHFLRKSSLDELPQLINVLKGDMRLVGNRPLPVYEAEALKENWQRIRFLAPAGITGLWQISGRSDLSEKERLALDAYYTVTRGFWSDFGILLKTVPALLMRKGAR